MASQNIARLGVVLGLDTAEFTASIDKAIAENVKLKNAIRRETDAAAKEIVNLKYATEDYGKTVSKVTQIEREMAAGRYKNATTDVKQKLLEQAKAYDAVAAATRNAIGAQFKMNEQQKMQLTYQTTDLFTQIASGQSPFIAIIQQGGQLKDAMGGVGNALRAIGSLFTVTSVLAGGFAAGIGAVAYAIYEADKEFDKFQDTLTLTGNYAGVTAKDLVAMSTDAANAAGTTVWKATDALTALVDSGKFTKSSLDSVANAVLVFAKVAGVDGKEAAEKLMNGLDGTASNAKQLNEKMNFLTFAQYKQIEALEKAGKKQEAAKLAADILSERMEAQKRILGETEGAWDKATRALSGYWDTFKKALFSGESPEDKLEKMNNQIKTLQTGLRNATGDEPFFAGKTKELEALIKRRDEFADLVNQKDQSIVTSDQKDLIAEYAKYGDMLKAKAVEVQKAISEAAYAEQKTRLNEIERIEREAADDIAKAKLEMAEKNRKEDYRASIQNATILTENEIVIKSKAAEKIKQIKAKERIETNKAQAEEEQRQRDQENAYAGLIANAQWDAAMRTKALERSKEDVDLKYQLIYATEKEMKLAELALQYKRKREDVTFGGDKEREELNRQEQIEKFLIETQDSMKRTQQVFDTVWGGMSSAIDNFVKTGKLNMKDFARSVIQDLIAIQMKAAAMRFLGAAFSMFSPTGASANPSQYALDFSGAKLGTRASGGSVTNNTPYLVGERGPELFMPSGSGTIIPNNQVGNMGGVTNVTNNYINAIDTKSFEDRLLGSSNAIWAANQYANKSLAVNRGRA